MSRTENKAPGAPMRSPRKDGNSSMGPGDLTPPSSEPLREEMEAPQMLMSPPPEETLRIARSKNASGTRASSSITHNYSEEEDSPPSNASKRKRNHATVPMSEVPSVKAGEGAVASSSRVTLEATPNPRARKQSKLHVSFTEEPTTPTKSSTKPPRSRASASPSKHSLLQSPHAGNFLADYVPPTSPLKKERASSRRRSATPVPHYEPPPDRFTPPREVVFTPVPTISKSSKRKSLAPSDIKSRRLTLQIKKEPPEIDLNAPLPPPSPTEDFLLLHGPPPSTKRRPNAPRSSLASTHSRDTPPISSSPVRPSQADDLHVQNLNFAMNVDSSDDELPLPPLFDFDKPENPDEPWTDDEVDAGASEFDHAGEYTGKFKMLTVPTKADPPSSMTRRRQDMWGRPISPFPRAKLLPALRHSPIPESPRQEDELPIAEYEDEEPELQSNGVRSPTPPRLSDPPPEGAGHDVHMEEPALEAPSPPSASPFHVSPQPADEHVDPVADDSFDDTPHGQSEAVSMESIVEYSVRIPSERDSSEPVGTHTEEQILDEGTSHFVETTHDTADDADDAESVLSYVEPGDLLPMPAPEDVFQEAANQAHQEGIPPLEEVETQPHEQQLNEQQSEALSVALVQPVDPPSEGRPPNTSSRNQVLDVVSPAVSPEGKHVDLPAESEPAPTDDEDDEQAEWSFGVPQSDAVDDEDMTLEEEDAFSVMRELSQAPEQRADFDAESRPAPLLLATPKLPLSPRNPFHVRTPGVAATSTASRFDATSEFRPGNASLPIFDLPEDDPDEALLDTSIVKITSSDPMAAARAAAILRLHKYDCVQHVPSPKHRTPFDLESNIKSARRRSVMQSAIGKSSTSLRRSALGGVIGNTVITNGTPRTSLADLLKEAEATIIMEEGSLHGLTPPKASTSFKTPRSISGSDRFQAARSTFETSLAATSGGPREWSKTDWKVLDDCYTDERLALGGNLLLPADQVDLEKVVDRFVAKVGEKVMVGLGPSWTQENLLKRVRALQRKQMRDNHAPPSMSSDTSVTQSWASSYQYSTLLSPNSSILKDLDRPSTPPPPKEATRTMTSVFTRQTAPSTNSAAFSTGDALTSTDVQYSRLLEDVIATEQGDLTTTLDKEVGVTPPQPEANRSFISPLLPGRAAHTLASKVKGLVFSYLPRSPKTAAAKPKPAPAANGPVLPVPPPEFFKKPRLPISTPAPKQSEKPAAPKDLVHFKKPRLPISTPAPKQSEKPAAPKDLVHLNRVPPPKPSMIPRPTQPQRWVQLNPVPSRPSSSTGFNSTAVRERRDSGASVKDLVKTFETMEKMQAAERQSQQRLDLTRKKSVKHWAETRMVKPSKPAWR